MNILIKIICLMVYLPNIKSDCTIEYATDTNVIPKFEKNVGKFKIRVPLSEAKKINYIHLYDKETLHGSCETYFSPFTCGKEEYHIPDYEYENPSNWRSPIRTVTKIISNQSSIALHCRESTLFYNDQQLSKQQFSCMDESFSIYSTHKPYRWCERNHNSSTFLFATDKATGKNILAAICFNINQVSLQTLVYNMTNLRRTYLSQPSDMKTFYVNPSEYLDENLWNFKTSIISYLSEELLREKLTEMSKEHEWLNLANYEVSLIVQNELLMEYFKGYENLLNVIWWRNLRVGNWKRFQDTLTNYSQNNSYEVYVGTSGIAQFPTNDEYRNEKQLEIKLGFQNETIPAYMWTYLKSNDNLNKEFVMVGYNSPFAEHFTTEEIIFCPDICSEIPWLHKIITSFRYTNAGIMFCCSTDFIRQTNYLQGFPLEVSMTPKIVSTIETTTAVKDSTKENILE